MSLDLIFDNLYDYTQDELINSLSEVLSNLDSLSDEDEIYKLKVIRSNIEDNKEILDKIDELIPEDEQTEVDSDNKEIKRTDFDLIPQEEVNVIQDCLEVIVDAVNEEETTNDKNYTFFNNPKCKIINQGLKDKTNCYTLDKYGLVIRKKAYNKTRTSPFGWKYNDKKQPVHINTEPMNTEEENIINVLNWQKSKYPELFKENGTITKVYRANPEFSDRLAKYCK